MTDKLELVIPEQFKELFQPSKPWRHLIYKGGRSSGKSTQVALSGIADLMRRDGRRWRSGAKNNGG